MSTLFGIILGLGICWWGHRKLGIGIPGISADHQVSIPPAPPETAQKPTTVTSSSEVRKNPKPKVAKATKPAKPHKAASRPAPRKKAKTEKPSDDLKRINGIGPKIADALNRDGVISFRQLSRKKPDELKKILENAGSRYRNSDLSTWASQAKFAARGDWDGAKAAWHASQPTKT